MTYKIIVDLSHNEQLEDFPEFSLGEDDYDVDYIDKNEELDFDFLEDFGKEEIRERPKIFDGPSKSSSKKPNPNEKNFIVENDFFRGLDKELNELKIVRNGFREVSIGKFKVKNREACFDTKEQLYKLLNSNLKIFTMPKLPNSSNELLKWKS